MWCPKSVRGHYHEGGEEKGRGLKIGRSDTGGAKNVGVGEERKVQRKGIVNLGGGAYRGSNEKPGPLKELIGKKESLSEGGGKTKASDLPNQTFSRAAALKDEEKEGVKNLSKNAYRE